MIYKSFSVLYHIILGFMILENASSTPVYPVEHSEDSMSLIAARQVLSRRNDSSVTDVRHSNMSQADTLDPSFRDYPYGTPFPGEFKWQSWREGDPNSDGFVKKDMDAAKKIHDGFAQWVELMRAIYPEVSKTDTDTYRRWFGEVSDYPKEVFSAMWNPDDGEDGGPSDMVSNFAVANTELFANFSRECKENPTLRTGSARNVISNFRSNKTEYSEVLYYCPYGLELSQRPNLTCDRVKNDYVHYPSVEVGMVTMAASLVYEFVRMYMNRQASGNTIENFTFTTGVSYGASDCFWLEPMKKLNNVQNYVWFALETYWSKKCDKVFKDPIDDGTFQGILDPQAPLRRPSHPPGASQGNTSESENHASCYGPGLVPAFDKAEAETHISEFCKQSAEGKTIIVPTIAIGPGPGPIANGSFRNLELSSSFPVNNNLDTLWMEITAGTSNCNGTKFYVDEDKCVRQLRATLETCDLDPGNGRKHGGWSFDGCEVYKLRAVFGAKQRKPWFQAHSDPFTLGNFTCRQLGHGEGYEGLPVAPCICWYSGMPSVLDAFWTGIEGCAGHNNATTSPTTGPE